MHHVDIWLLDKEKLSTQSYDWQNILSKDEQERANRFHFSEDRTSFVIFHACKRRILANYLHQTPHEIRISTHTKGKPFLLDNPVHFNLSHTKNMAILAVTQHTEIGVDIEKIKKTSDYLAIAKRFFHPDEYRYIKEIPDEQQQLNAFFEIWTAKEAILKATGEGIAAGMNHFCVPCNHLKTTTPEHPYLKKITLSHLKTPAGYTACLATLHPTASITYQELI